jgi:hypothetical protein
MATTASKRATHEATIPTPTTVATLPTTLVAVSPFGFNGWPQLGQLAADVET